MLNREMMRTLAAFLLVALSSYAAGNVAGKWSGTMRISAAGEPNVEVPAVLVLQQKGAALTGTLTPAQKNPETIYQGKIEGNKVSFEIRGGNPPVSKFDGELAGVVLTLTSDFQGQYAGGERPVRVTLTLKPEPSR